MARVRWFRVGYVLCPGKSPVWPGVSCLDAGLESRATSATGRCCLEEDAAFQPECWRHCASRPPSKPAESWCGSLPDIGTLRGLATRSWKVSSGAGWTHSPMIRRKFSRRLPPGAIPL